MYLILLLLLHTTFKEYKQLEIVLDSETPNQCKDPFKRVLILEKIVNVQTQCTCAACQRRRSDMTNQLQAEIDKQNEQTK
jgi:hypothetical protein